MNKPLKLKEVLYKFDLYHKYVKANFTRTNDNIEPLTVGYAIFALRTFFNGLLSNNSVYAPDKTAIGNKSIVPYDDKAMKIVEEIPINLIVEIYNILTYELFEEPRANAFTIDPNDLSLDDLNFYNYLLAVDFNSFRGTPLQKAVMLSFIITKNAMGKGKGDGSGGEGEGEGTESKLTDDPAEAQGDDKIEKGAMAGSLGCDKINTEQAEMDREMIEKIKPNPFRNGVFNLNDASPIGDVKAILDNETKNTLELTTAIDDIKQWSLKSKRKFTFSPKSKKKRSQHMTNMSQLPKVSVMSRANPLFNYKLLMKELRYRDRYIVEDERQLSIVLIDDSGSMSDSFKLKWRNAVLFNRLEAVALEKADLVLHYYETRLHRTYTVTKKEEALPLYHSLKNHNPGGGGTDIEGCLLKAMKEAEDYISKHKKISHDLPVNILIVCDGQDTFSANTAMAAHAQVCKDTKMKFIVNGVIIGTKHEQLKKFCEHTGGVFIYR